MSKLDQLTLVAALFVLMFFFYFAYPQMLASLGVHIVRAVNEAGGIKIITECERE